MPCLAYLGCANVESQPTAGAWLLLQVSQAAILAFQQLAQLLPAPRATAASKRAVDRLEARGTDDGTLAAVRLLAHTVSCWTQVALQQHVPRYINRWANHRDFSVREVGGIASSTSDRHACRHESSYRYHAHHTSVCGSDTSARVWHVVSMPSAMSALDCPAVCLWACTPQCRPGNT
jgi:hypothetical protein